MDALNTKERNAFAWLAAIFTLVLAHQAKSLAEPPGNDGGKARHRLDDVSHAIRNAAQSIGPSVVAIQALHGPRCTEEWSRAKGGSERTAPPITVDDHLSANQTESDGDRMGSGIILDAAGIIVTNFHIVERADAIIVRLADEQDFPATEVYGDGVTDLAIIRIAPPRPLHPVPLGDSDKTRVGDWVVAIGNPFGLERSTSAGIVSGKDRKMQHNGALLIQTDAASNPGNSGGPLVNLDGQVVGIVEGASGKQGESQGVNFAVPINVVKRVAAELLRNGRMIWPSLGADSQPLTPIVAEELRLPRHQLGLLLTAVTSGMPAERAGLQPGDVITQFAGQHVESPVQFDEILNRTPVGTRIPLTILRRGSPMTKAVELEPFSMPLPPKTSSHGAPGGKVTAANGDMFGLTVGEFDQGRSRKRLGYGADVTGALITDVGPESSAYASGIRAGMIIHMVGDEKITSPRQLKSIVSNRARDKQVLFLIGSPQGNRFVVLKKPRT